MSVERRGRRLGTQGAGMVGGWARQVRNRAAALGLGLLCGVAAVYTWAGREELTIAERLRAAKEPRAIVALVRQVKAEGRLLDEGAVRATVVRLEGADGVSGTETGRDRQALLGMVRELAGLCQDRPMLAGWLREREGGYLQAEGRLGEAADALARAGAALAPPLGQTIIEQQRVLHQQGVTYQAMGQLEKADACFEQVIGYGWWNHDGSSEDLKELASFDQNATTFLLELRSGNAAKLEELAARRGHRADVVSAARAVRPAPERSVGRPTSQTQPR